MKDNWIDDIVKKALEDYQAEDQSQMNWDQMEQKIDAELTGMDPLDDFVKNALGDFTPQSINMDDEWARMEAAIDSELIDQDPLDNIVRSKVSQYTPAYDPSSWEKLLHKIEKQAEFEKRYLRIKALEATFVFMLLLTFFNIYPDIIDKKDIFSAEYLKEKILSKETAQDVITYHDQKTDEALEADNANTITLEANQDVTQNNTDENITISLSDISRIDDNPVLASLVDQDESNTPSSLAASNIDNAISNQAYIAKTENVKEGIDLMPLLKFQDVQLTETPVILADKNVRLTLSERAHQNLFLVDQLENEELKSLYTVLDFPKPKFRKKTNIKVGIYASTDLNLATIKETEFYTNSANKVSFEEKKDQTIGYGTGISILVEKGKLGIHSGLAYSNRHYNPDRTQSLRSSARHLGTTHFKRVSHQMIHLPVNLSYEAYTKGRMKLYGLAGASLSMVARAYYDVITKSALPQPLLLGEESEEFGKQSALLRDNFLKDSKFNENSSLTVNLGFGTEYKLSPRYSFFVEPQYKHQLNLNSIGANQKDDINTVSLLLGTRIAIR